MLRVAVASILSLVYPHPCRVCQDLVDALHSGSCCQRCWNEARLFSGSEMLCSKCGSLLGDRSGNAAVNCGVCGDLAFDSAASLGVYGGALSAAVIELKRFPYLDGHLRNIIRDCPARKSGIFDVDIVVPVPLSTVRRAERGFNQAALIADEIGRICGLPVDTASLVRTRHTKMHRIGMDSKARTMASLNAFSVTRKQLISGQRILLVDDVMTSGATAAACAAVLKKNGSGEVNIFTIARAVMS